MVTTANKKPVLDDSADKPVIKTAVVPAKKIATAAKLASNPEAMPKAPVVKEEVKAVAKKVVAKKVAVAKAKPVTKVAKSAVKTKVLAKPNTVKIAKAATPKPVMKSVAVKAATKPAAKLSAATAHKEKAKKEKLVRDSFTMPESEYVVLSHVKKACLSAGVEVKKSQLLRIGLVLLNKTDLTSLKTLIAGLAPLKAGRPKKEK